MSDKRPPSLADQAQFVRLLSDRTKCFGGEQSPEAWLRLTAGEVDLLDNLAAGLELLAEHDDAVRKAVMAGMRAKKGSE